MLVLGKIFFAVPGNIWLGNPQFNYMSLFTYFPKSRESILLLLKFVVGFSIQLILGY